MLITQAQLTAKLFCFLSLQLFVLAGIVRAFLSLLVDRRLFSMVSDKSCAKCQQHPTRCWCVPLLSAKRTLFHVSHAAAVASVARFASVLFASL